MSLQSAVEQESSLPSNNTGISSALHFVIERSLLLKSLAHVQSVVERRNAIPILSNVKLVATEGRLSLTSTDLDIAITETIDASVQVEGALTVSAHTFYDIVRKLPDGSDVEFKGDAGNTGKVLITAGSCEFNLSSLPVDDFPSIDTGSLTHRFNLSSEELVSMFDKTRFAISTEETRYYLNGIYLHLRQGENGAPVIAAVATDGHRLAKVEIAAPENSENLPGVIVPRKTVVELKKLLDGAEGEVSIGLSDTKIHVVSGNAELTSKLIDGTFPDYEKVIPTGNDKFLDIETQQLAKAIDRISTIASEKTRAIKFSLSEGNLHLSATNEDNGSGFEDIAVNFDASDLEIGFNSRYLLEMMAGLSGETVQFAFADNNAPALVRDPSDTSALYVIMPMRI